MAETDLFPLEPDFPVQETRLPGLLSQEADSGRFFERVRRPDRRLFELQMRGRTTDELETLRGFYARLKGRFFRFDHKVYVNDNGTLRTRSFPVRFAAPPEAQLLPGDQNWTIRATLVESPGDPLPPGSYPDPTLGFESYFREEDDQDAQPLVGTWTTQSHANAHAGQHKTNNNTNTTDKFRFTYFGYGFRYWVRKNPDLGILQLLLDNLSLATIDLFAATGEVAAPLLTKLDVPLGLHTVDVKATNTKNASATNQFIHADAVEVLP